MILGQIAYNPDVDINRIQILAIIGSLGIFLFVVELIRKKRIKEEYSLLWLFFGAIFVLLSVWRRGLDEFSELIGVAYPPAALFLLLLMAVFMILIQFSIIISKQSESIKKMAQEIGLIKIDLEKAKKDIQKQNNKINEDIIRP